MLKRERLKTGFKNDENAPHSVFTRIRPVLPSKRREKKCKLKEIANAQSCFNLLTESNNKLTYCPANLHGSIFHGSPGFFLLAANFSRPENPFLILTSAVETVPPVKEMRKRKHLENDDFETYIWAYSTPL